MKNDAASDPQMQRQHVDMPGRNGRLCVFVMLLTRTATVVPPVFGSTC